jgi:hypothetical protein
LVEKGLNVWVKRPVVGAFQFILAEHPNTEEIRHIVHHNAIHLTDVKDLKLPGQEVRPFRMQYMARNMVTVIFVTEDEKYLRYGGLYNVIPIAIEPDTSKHAWTVLPLKDFMEIYFPNHKWFKGPDQPEGDWKIYPYQAPRLKRSFITLKQENVIRNWRNPNFCGLRAGRYWRYVRDTNIRLNAATLPDHDLMSLTNLIRHIGGISFRGGAAARDIWMRRWNFRVLESKLYATKIMKGASFEVKAMDPSGHLQNMMLMSHFVPICFKLWIDSVLQNVAAASGDVQARSEIMEAVQADMITGYPSDPKTRFWLWHNIYEYFFGIHTYIITAFALAMEPNLDLVAFLSRKLKEILVRFPIFSKTSPKGREIIKRLTHLIGVDGDVFRAVTHEGAR